MKRRAMTLVEILMGMGLSLLLSGVVVGLLKTGRTFFLAGLDETALNDLIYRVPRKMIDGLMASHADSVTPGKSTFSFESAFDANDTFCLNPDGTPHWQGRQTYYLRGDRLYRLDPKLAPKVMARSVEGLSLVELSQGTFQLTLDLNFRGYTRECRREVKLCVKPVN